MWPTSIARSQISGRADARPENESALSFCQRRSASPRAAELIHNCFPRLAACVPEQLSEASEDTEKTTAGARPLLPGRRAGGALEKRKCTSVLADEIASLIQKTLSN